MLESIKCSTSGAYYLRGQWVPADAQAPAALAAAGVTAEQAGQAYKGTMAYGILTAHNTSGSDRDLRIKFDAMASHDITFVGIIQTARASGLEKFPIPYVLTNCHNSLCAVGGTINQDDHVFALSAAAARMECECGKEALTAETDGLRFRLQVPCGVCGGHHQAECDADAVLHGRGIGLACPAKQELCCYIGEEAQVRKAMEGLALRVAKEKASPDEAFTDNVIMYEVLSELKDIAARGGIACACGSHEYTMQVRRGAVDLTCAKCGGRLRLPAATDSDLDDLCCRMTLTIPGR